MPKLKPLEQFFCDTCGDVIDTIDAGYVVWAVDRDKRLTVHSFRIVHQDRDDLPGSRRCDDDRKYPSSLPLKDWLGAHGVIEALQFIDVGRYHDREYLGHRVRDLREWTEFMRRLHVPYYEEARRYWDRACSEYFEDVDDVRIFMPDYLAAMIEHFEREDAAE